MPTDHVAKITRMEEEGRVTHVTIDHSASPDTTFEVCLWAGDDGPYPIASGDDYLELRACLDDLIRGRYPLKADTVLELLRAQRLPEPIGWVDARVTAAATDHLDRMPPAKLRRCQARVRKVRRENLARERAKGGQRG